MTAPTVAFEQPVVSPAPRRHVLFRHAIVEHADLGEAISATFAELYRHIRTSGTFPAGPPFVVYHAGSEVGVQWDIDVCAPIATPITPPPEFGYKEMPGGPAVTLMHVGSYDSIGSAYAQLEAYLDTNHIHKAGEPREFYLSEPGVPPSEARTMIEWPISQL